MPKSTPRLRQRPAGAPSSRPAPKTPRKKKRTQPPPRARQRGLYYPTDVTPEKFYAELGKLRREAEAEIERLIDWLDAVTPDPDLEDDDREPDQDGEPSLSAPENHPGRGMGDPCQLGWGRGFDNDAEEEHDGREPDDSDYEDGADDEPDADGEPTLGWPEAGHGVGGNTGIGDDEREHENYARDHRDVAIRARLHAARIGRSNVRNSDGSLVDPVTIMCGRREARKRPPVPGSDGVILSQSKTQQALRERIGSVR